MYLDMGQFLGLFERTEEFEFCFVAGGADNKFNFHMVACQLGDDAHHPYTDRKDSLQIHKHPRPVKAPRVDQGIEKGSALMQLGILLAAEELFQLLPLAPQANHLALDFCGPSAVLLVPRANNIHVEAENQEKESGYGTHQASGQKKAPVRLDRFCREIEPNLHRVREVSLPTVQHPADEAV